VNTTFDPANVTVLVAVGGRATRALYVTADAIPKHLIVLDNGPTILEVVCRQLQLVGFRRFVFCTGYHHAQISSFVRSERWISHDQVHYEISSETEPAGLEGAFLAGINKLGITGQAMFIVGDAFIPWNELVNMNEEHARRQTPITWGLTSHITERTADPGKVIVDPTDGRRVVRNYYGRAEDPVVGKRELALTSAGVWVVSPDAYREMCREYKASRGMDNEQPIGPQDSVILWAASPGRHDVYGYDLRGEVLDLGERNIRYGQMYWRQYVSG